MAPYGISLAPGICDRLNEAESFAYCHALARRTGRNFYFSFLTLPRREFRGMCALYAFLRVTDDLGDSSDPVTDRMARLQAWESQFSAALAGETSHHPVLRAVVALVRQEQLPAEPLFDTIRGVRRDLEAELAGGVNLISTQDLRNYCYLVAGAVGLACIHVWGCRDPAARPAALACGEAFQRTNILRDVFEDAAVNRFYIPQEECDLHHCTRSDLGTGQSRERVRGLLESQVVAARQCYDEARALFDYLPPAGRPVLAAMIGIYGALLDQIGRNPLIIYRGRVSLPSWQKLVIVSRSLLAEQGRRGRDWLAPPMRPGG
jgi:phytoene synthase